MVVTRKMFQERFLNAFAPDLTNHERRKFCIDWKGRGYLWHLFSNSLVPCFAGDKARDAYDVANKTDALQIQYDYGLGDEIMLPLSPSYVTASKVDQYGYTEFYIIGKDFSWCYVITHELDSCGPYFCYNPNLK
ncbi:MAG: DUF4275 family protein [Ruminococcaceae bacterium]|nr:DUF4275 family protein [Oscillospiraceae bacterium]